MKQILAASLLLAGTFAVADEGQRYIHYPVTITTPGEYRVTRDLAALTGNALTIDADGVELDLGGHILTTGDASAAVIRIVAGHTGITIHDGVLQGGFSGIIYDSATGNARMRIEQVNIYGSGDYCIYLAGVDHVDFLHNQVRDCAEEAVYIQGLSSQFTGRFIANEIADVNGGGLYLFGLRGGEVRDNQVVNTGMATSNAGGIVLTGDLALPAGGNTVSGNRIVDGQGNTRGIHVTEASLNNLITGNVLAGNGGDGLHVESDGNRIVDNMVDAGGRDGIRVDAARNTVRSNQVRGNTGEGIRVGGNFNLLDANLAEVNGSHGIWFDASGMHVYRNNMLRDNGVGSVGGAGKTNGGGTIL